MNIGDKIRKLREEKGYTLEELGNIIGVGKSTVRKWETGEITNMRRDSIENLAKALDISPLSFFETSDSTISNSSILNNYGDSNENTFHSSTTNNFFENKKCDNKTTSSENSKSYFFTLLDNIREMDDEQLLEMIRYSEYLLSKS